MAMQVNDNNKKRKALLIAAISCFVLQLAIVPNFGLFDGRINICMITAVFIALGIGGKTGVIAGFIAGLFFDLTTTGPVGLMAFELTLASYFIGMESRNKLIDGHGIVFQQFLIACVLVELIYALAMILTGHSTNILFAFGMHTIPAIVLDSLVFVAVLLIFSSRMGGSAPSFSGKQPGHGARFSGKKF
ncbi:rod shape-determining protein MreD [Atopobium fossor]|uniref:rod shape-determining protein MreD n=1 Tax=Atopobium fossor TaxID=39487 RepID=UPI000413B8E9|nr:rod shape-determining protein MreD [Atopobium fossor]